MTSIVQHPNFRLLLPCLRMSRYPEGGRRPPGFDVSPADIWQAQLFLAWEAACPNPTCPTGGLIHVVRQRNGSGKYSGLYFTVSCDWTLTLVCSRTQAAHDEMDRVREEYDAWLSGQPPPLVHIEPQPVMLW